LDARGSLRIQKKCPTAVEYSGAVGAAGAFGPSDPLAIDPDPPGLVERLEADGWQSGAPANVTLRSRRIDAAAAARLQCSDCRRRGLSYRPFHKGSRYRAVASCACGGACGGAAEL
jgi:hypothetical protein